MAIIEDRLSSQVVDATYSFDVQRPVEREVVAGSHHDEAGNGHDSGGGG